MDPRKRRRSTTSAEQRGRGGGSATSKAELEATKARRAIEARTALTALADAVVKMLQVSGPCTAAEIVASLPAQPDLPGLVHGILDGESSPP